MLSWEYPPYVVGGMGKHVAELVPVLGGQTTSSGPIHIDVVTSLAAGGALVEHASEFVTIYRVPQTPFDPQDTYNSVVSNNQFLVDRAAELGDAVSYDLVHAHDWLVSKAGVQLKHRWKLPLITTMHATERGRYRGHIPDEMSYQIDRMEWLSCFEAWRVIACSEYMRRELHDYFDLPYNKIKVLPNGVSINPDELCTQAEIDALRAAHAPNGEPLLLFVGRMVHEKGLQVLLRAMPRILAEFPEIKLLVAGKNGSTFFPTAYELNVDRSVVFLDFVSNRQRDCLYRIADAAIFPSLYEPFGIVALEAMAAGCNVIASSVGGLAEIVHHLENGLTVYPNDPLSIVWAVRQVLTDPAAAERRRANGLQEVEMVYNWERIARQTAALYDQVVQERRQTDW